MTAQTTDLTAGVILIGNELLSGSTEDKNLAHIARKLGELGIQVAECRIIPDDEQEIVDLVNLYRQRYTYVFTTGGIGPTHDDITMNCVAKAFGVEMYRDQGTVEKFKKHYGDRATEATYTMCDFPVGAELIEVENNITPAPCFRLENVYVLAGVPKIMQHMLDEIIPTLKKGTPILTHTYTAYTTESKISKNFSGIQENFGTIELGSYPFLLHGKYAVKLVARGRDADAVVAAGEQIHEMLNTMGAEIVSMDVS